MYHQVQEIFCRNEVHDLSQHKEIQRLQESRNGKSGIAYSAYTAPKRSGKVK